MVPNALTTSSTANAASGRGKSMKAIYIQQHGAISDLKLVMPAGGEDVAGAAVVKRNTEA